MKNLLLTSIFVVTVVLTSFATNTKTNNTIIETATIVSFEGKVNTICKLIQEGNIEGVRNLIENGTDINQKSCGMTPLMYAARQNKVEIVKLLLSRSVKLKTKSEKGLTALDYARISKANESYALIEKAMNA